MKRGVDELVEVLEEIKENATSNQCGMKDITMFTLAHALRSLYYAKVPKRYSREKASIELGVSTRQLKRLADSAGVKPKRDGYKNIYYTEEDLDKIRAFKMDRL